MLAVATSFHRALLRGVLSVGDRGGQRVQCERRFPETPYDTALDELSHAVDVEHIVHGEHPHEDAPVELVLQQPLMGEQPERLPQGVPGDAERAAHVPLGQPDPRREEPFGDPGTQHARDRSAVPDRLNSARSPASSAVSLGSVGPGSVVANWCLLMFRLAREPVRPQAVARRRSTRGPSVRTAAGPGHRRAETSRGTQM